MRYLMAQMGNQHELQFREEVGCGEKSKTFELEKFDQ